tara:strand:- start:2621 stop:3838 length:1218 start_codon:yes stop_codon:yes gene_type:complete
VILTNRIKKEIIFETNPKFFQTNKVEKSLNVFNKKVKYFFDELSFYIFKNPQIKSFPDLASFGFFCRKANIKFLENKYLNFLENRYGRGLVLHFTPSNVPLNFAYSLFFGLITGNSNIIRLSNNNHDQAKILIKIINELLKKKKFFELRKKINLIRYDKSDQITKHLSSICDARVIWGGDKSINEIRKYPLSPNAFDVTFADKYSICIISAKNYLKSKLFEKEAEFFYNDTLFFDQNACTSPKIVIWHGDNKNINLAKKKFWIEFEKIIKKKNYKIHENWNYEKFYKETNAIIDLNIKDNKSSNSIIKRLQLVEASQEINKYFTPGGFFFEFDFNQFSKIKKFFSSKVQTLTYIGFEPHFIKKKLNLGKLKSVDRIVPNGKSSEMSLEWDGYEIIFQISKKLTII